jgi:S-adenosylmethionine hydrolase
VQAAVEISQSPWRLTPVSATFHGRDIFAPVAARLAAGDPLEEAGEPLAPTQLVRLHMQRPWIESGALVAQVSNVDQFGNAQLTAGRDDVLGLELQLGDVLQVATGTGDTHTASFARTFSDVPEGELILFEDSSHRLALGFNQGSATGRLPLRIGDEVRITRPEVDVSGVVRSLWPDWSGP